VRPSKRAKSHHVIGEVVVKIDNGRAQIFYVVFPTRVDAVANWRDADAELTNIKSRLPAPPQFPKPSAILNGSFWERTSSVRR
jgi:hypothetical protein